MTPRRAGEAARASTPTPSRNSGPRRRRAVAVVGALGLVAVLVVPASAYPRPGATERVSVASDGSQDNGSSFGWPAISADGRYVAFGSAASNLVAGDTNGTWDVFVRDRQTGTTERVSVASDGTEGDGSSDHPAISADGRYVAFRSFASTLVPGDTNNAIDVFVHDRQTGTTERVSVASDGTEAVANSNAPAISADGRYVAFGSFASTLVPGDTNGRWDVFVHDRQTGTTERVSVASDGTQGEDDSGVPSMSADGRHVAFSSRATTLVPDDTNGAVQRELGWDVFVHDRQAGTTERVSVASDGTEADNGSLKPSISADGRHVAFQSGATNLVPGDTNRGIDVFVHDREAGTTERVSVASDGTEHDGGGFGPPFGGAFDPAISGDGRYVTFQSAATNLVPGDTNATYDIFVHDRETGTTERVSVASDGTEGNARSVEAAISADGRHVAYESDASNLVSGDTNAEDCGLPFCSAKTDIFVRDRGPTTGVGGLGAQQAPGELLVSGWATFGATVAAAEDPEDDGVGPAGAEIVDAAVIHRPEREDVLLRLRLASLPGPVAGGAPGILYRWSFTAAGTVYEVRALRVGAVAAPPGAPFFALYECDLVCTETTRLTGGIGTTGAEVRVSVPVEALAAEEGVELTEVTAATALGEAAPGSLVILDDVDLPDAAIVPPRVELGLAEPSAPQSEVAFSAPAELVEGRFSGTLDVSGLPATTYRVWARACLGETCGAAWIEVAL